jgi:DNA-binding NarL/FixJ family response regulator
MANEKVTTLDEVHEELRVHNRLTILSLVREGVKQKDIAAAVGVSESAVSLMFPKGLLKRIGHASKLGANGLPE